MIQLALKTLLLAEGWIILLLGLFFILLIIINISKIKTRKKRITEDSIEPGIYLKKTYQTRGDELNYNIIYPDNFDPAHYYPLLIFLHGAGERGDDNEAQLKYGGELIKVEINIHQCIAIIPQCPKENYWIDVLEQENSLDGVLDFEPDINAPAAVALALVIELIQTYKQKKFVDKSRIYIGGLSMGGMGAFDLCWRMPGIFAAAFAICGAGSTVKAKEFSGLPIRIYHGEDDQIVKVEKSLEIVEALKTAGGSPEVFIYPRVGHYSWENAFSESDFFSWLLKHKI